MARVIVLGGGVAGLSAAHELIERGFEVHVYEKAGVAGGKARSYGVPGSAAGGRRPLPAEHGFRFFPGFYRHLTDTMERIPTGPPPRRAAARLLQAGRRRLPVTRWRHTVAANLVEASMVQVSMAGRRAVTFPVRYPWGPAELSRLLSGLVAFWVDSGIAPAEREFYLERIWQLMTSCQERRQVEYERLSWWDFVGASGRSRLYQDLLADSPRPLVACKPREASTKTVGDILLQMIFHLLTRGAGADRVLNAPTSDAWITPWVRYLEARGVVLHLDCPVQALGFAGGRITGATVLEQGRAVAVGAPADAYVAALPVEVMAPLVTEAMVAAEPALAGLAVLAREHTAWMNGLLFYLRRDVPLVHGHQLYLGSPWALTSISQAQFWRGVVDLAGHGDGQVRGVLSVIISDWTRPGLKHARPAAACTREEIIEEVWHQLKLALNHGAEEVLHDADLHSVHLDEAIRVGPPGPGPTANAEPLLVNKAGARHLRPSAVTAIPNLFLASDYVLTHTDLATMEGANEAARHAVNGIIAAAGRDRPARARLWPYCKIWTLHEPAALAPLRRHDARRYPAPWSVEMPLRFRLLYWILSTFPGLVQALAALLDLLGRLFRRPPCATCPTPSTR